MPEDSYDDAVKWLYDLQYFGMKLGLSNTRALLEELGNPHEKLRAIHVAGTNGKGSVCAFMTGILMESGLKVGTYTSPHLSHFGERIAINNFPMTRQEVLRAIHHMKPKVQALAARDIQCTFFEVTTCMAFWHFARRKVDAAVIEVGMGGRLDSTNVLEPELAIITNISREHTQHLGDTIRKIAGEKAGIIKKGVPTVTSEKQPEALKVIRGKAREMGSELHEVAELVDVKVEKASIMGSVISVKTKKNNYKNIHIKLAGRHQATNAACSILAAEVLASKGFTITKEHIIRGMEHTGWAGRLQVVRRRPTVILDSTHNPGGAETLASFLREHCEKEPPVIVLGMLADKEVHPVVELLEPLASKFIVTQSNYDRRMKAEELAAHFSGEPEIVSDLSEAVDRAIEVAGESGHALITGSIFTASEALAHLDLLRINEMMNILGKLHGIGAYPGRNPETDGPPPPGSQDPFRVLISTILSQRTKDENTHLASEALFSKYGTPEELANADAARVEELVRPAGFYKQKAQKVIQTSRIIVEEFHSRVPDTIEELTGLPGVGRKTANCVLAYGFGLPAIAVDTHVHRISNLLGLVKTEAPDDTEEMLSLIVPKERWHDINRLLVRHGQSICGPINPKCEKCPISHLCQHGIYH